LSINTDTVSPTVIFINFFSNSKFDIVALEKDRSNNIWKECNDDEAALNNGSSRIQQPEMSFREQLLSAMKNKRNKKHRRK
jgi:hypothetical protein